MSQELEIRSEITPAEMLNAAIKQGIDPEGIRILAETYERLQEKQNEREFTAALLAFRAHCPPIPKTDNGVHNQKFAPFHRIAAIVDPVLLKHGLVYMFNAALISNTHMEITCLLSHVQGYSRTTTFSAPIEPAPRMTLTHAAASASSLAKRYALLLALGLSTGEVDDDGRALLTTISEEQQQVLAGLLEETQSNNAAFWKFAGVDVLEEIPVREYSRIESALLAKKRGR